MVRETMELGNIWLRSHKFAMLYCTKQFPLVMLKTMGPLFSMRPQNI